MKTLIPLFRAKKIDSDEYVEGYISPSKIGNFLIGCPEKWKVYKCDSLTLAIHFPDMIDSEGNKIFASLSEDGKGGDIIEWSIFPDDDNEKRINGVPFYSKGGVFKITDRVEMLWHNLAPHRKCKVTGIQQ